MRINQSTQFQNMKKMLATKNRMLKELKSGLEKYEPSGLKKKEESNSSSGEDNDDDEDDDDDDDD